MKCLSSVRLFVAAAVGLSVPSATIRAGIPGCTPTTFIQADALPGGSSGHAVAEDLNGDGNVDLVNSAGGLVIHLGNGDGTFSPPTFVPNGDNITGLVTADFNGDGKPDLATADTYAIKIFLGNGDGTFVPSGNYAGAIIPNGLVVGDFDGDGHLDLAETGVSAGLTLLLGQGDGTFSPQFVSIDAGTASLGAGDFNGDGLTDLVISFPYVSTLAIYPSNGDGTFGAPFTAELDPNLGQVAVGDLDGDGKLDVVVALTPSLAVLLGNGDGTLQSAQFSALEVPPDAIAIGDLDGDGVLDLAVQQGSWQIISILHGDGTGLFTAVRSYQSGSSFPAVVDLDGDGDLDIVSVDVYSSELSILFNEGRGRFRGIPSVVAPTFPTVFAAGDFNGDGRNDLAVLLAFRTIRLFAGDGDAGFQAIADVVIDADWLAAGDWNGDGHLDLVTSSSSSMSLSVLLGNGNGSFQPAMTVPLPFRPQRIAAGDLERNGFLDLIIGAVTPGGQGTVAVLLGNGDGTFGPLLQRDVSGSPVGVVTADFNADGRLDVAVVAGQPSNIATVLLGNGDGTFASPAEFATGPGPASLDAGDFDGDGNTDLIVANGGASSVSLLLGDGTGSFAPAYYVAVGFAPVFVAVADFNGDGKLDFATANAGTNNVSLLLGQGNGAFSAPEVYPAFGSPQFLAVADLTGGGAVDLAVGTSGVALALLLNARLDASAIANGSVVTGNAAALTVSASGFGPLSYQWRKNGVPLADGGPVSGATTATLTIDPAAFADAGSYDVVLTDSCTSVTSNAATLSVEFADVPLTNPFHADIIVIATTGITVGCGGPNYCPGASVSRAEMAVFLLKAKFGANHVPPPPPPIPIFPDVPADAFAAAWIDEIAALGVTAGCGDGNGDYCPDASVTREQLAVFLLKTLLGFDYAPPPAAGIFSDVPPDSFAADWVEDLYNRGITAGCAVYPLRYCPEQPVSREEMATLLVRTFALP